MNNSFINSIRFNFLYIDRYSFGKSWVYPESYLPYGMLRYVIKGNAIFFIDGKEFEVKEGDIVYLPVGCKLSCHALNDDFSFYSIRFATSVNYDGGDLLTDYFHIPTVIHDINNEGRMYFEKMYKCIKTDHDSRMFWVRGYLELIIGYVIDKGKRNIDIDRKELIGEEEFSLERIKKRTRKSDVSLDPRIQVVVDYIILHPTEQYTISKMSRMAELSESRFRTLFKQQVGKNPLEYLNEIRVMTAARKLLVSGDNISDIAYEVGYEDANYFSRIFKKYFCITPKQYRDNAKE
ncbi:MULTISPECIES: AraC family transcriptional regulator [Clostridium]|mgnify:CR=1 FL=1|jgi:AraC-like DNA-binding protein|uniref:AraC family transcriptional regulator n=1 Tax=Clostridium TaxID=1485 RepID=UPI001DE99A72|nr:MULTISPECIES: helix-turn-helix domain-containing protein [Clostridium]MBS5306075.1 helix-turn-helix domain-containing protein [Clostridium sp.]MBS6503023.1 helix-turn-helix domain-containing protein [Clostridium sp.]MDB1944496.1 AraC family transcriptional regulator [Clostridium tertium]MDB1951763.1 AraC family transcriptional regulator [Clostridium tertium]MDU1278810.1 AraC family transcriptional regulator [Clostridium sp.]